MARRTVELGEGLPPGLAQVIDAGLERRGQKASARCRHCGERVEGGMQAAEKHREKCPPSDE